MGLAASWHMETSQIRGQTCVPCIDRRILNYWITTEALMRTTCFSSVQFGRSALSESMRLQGLQHARPPCPSPTPGAYSDSCPLIRWCHANMSAFVVPFSSCFQSFPASGSFQMSQSFTSCGQSIGVSASASVLPMNIQD